jgi:hypothetical protein
MGVVHFTAIPTFLRARLRGIGSRLFWITTPQGAEAPSNEMSCAMTFDQEKGYCDVSELSNFGPCLIWKRPSTVSQIQPE